MFYNSDLDGIGLGYFIDSNFWGKGYATEMALALLQWVKENTKIREIFAYAHTKNRSSINIMKKIGMEYIGIRILRDMECSLYRKDIER